MLWSSLQSQDTLVTRTVECRIQRTAVYLHRFVGDYFPQARTRGHSLLLLEFTFPSAVVARHGRIPKPKS